MGEESDVKRRKLDTRSNICWVHQADDVPLVHYCPKGHGICLDCLRNACSDQLAQVCKAEDCGVHLDSRAVVECFPIAERHVLEKKMADGLALAAARPGEETRRCPCCDYMEVDDQAACSSTNKIVLLEGEENRSPPTRLLLGTVCHG